MKIEEDRPASREELLTAAFLGVLGASLALAAVYVGNGWQDGFDYSGTWYLKRRLLRMARWLLPAAALAGPALFGYFTGIRKDKTPWRVLLAVPRAFVHFPLHAMIILIAVMFTFLKHVAVVSWRWMRAKFARAPSFEEKDMEAVLTRAMTTWAGAPIWFLFLPFALAGIKPQEGSIPFPSVRGLRPRLVFHLPFVLAMIVFFTHFVSEETGDRVDPYWLSVFASFWLTDYLVVLGTIVPVMARREAGEMLR